MNRSALPYAAACALGVLACASAPPAKEMADTQAAIRSASELGAEGNPQAQLHYSLAQQQVTGAEAAMKKGDDEEATRLLRRAQSDAELAVALMHEHKAKQEADRATSQFQQQQQANSTQGATP